MREVIRVVQAVRQRVYVNLLLRHSFEVGVYAVGAMAAAFLVAKIVFFPNAMSVLGVALLLTLTGVAVYAVIAARMNFLPAALAADEGLHMAERFSTAIVVARDPSPMAAAVVLDARAHARNINVKRQFPLVVPERWWRLTTALGVLLAVLIMPQFDPFGRQAAFTKKQKEKAQVAKSVQELRKRIAEAKRELQGMEFAPLQELDNLDLKLAEMEKLQLGKKEALAFISQSLENLSEKMKQSAKDLSQKGEGAKDELAKALGQQQKALEKEAAAVEKAKAEMAKLAEELKNGALSKEDAAKVAEALAKMAEGLPKNSELAQQMQKAAAALKSGNQQAAAQAAQDALSAAQTQLAGLQNQMGLLSQQIATAQQGSPQNPQSGMPGMMGMQQMSAQQAAQEIQAMNGALNGMNGFKESTTGTESVSMAQAMAMLQQSGLRGGRDQNAPGSNDNAHATGKRPIGADTGAKPEASTISGEMRQGQMLSSFLTKGGQIKNESKVEYTGVVLESKQRAKDALTDQKVPRTYEKAVREYFDSLEAPAAK